MASSSFMASSKLAFFCFLDNSSSEQELRLEIPLAGGGGGLLAWFRLIGVLESRSVLNLRYVDVGTGACVDCAIVLATYSSYLFLGGERCFSLGDS